MTKITHTVNEIPEGDHAALSTLLTAVLNRQSTEEIVVRPLERQMGFGQAKRTWEIIWIGEHED